MFPTRSSLSEDLESFETLAPDDIVISGMSGVFPNSDSVHQFKENLYNKVDMVTSNPVRWQSNSLEIPQHLGVINDLWKFDAQFFMVHSRTAHALDPMSRKILEHAYGAIYDAGYNVHHIHGSKIGVFIGVSFSDNEKHSFYEDNGAHAIGLLGNNKTMFANRISYWLNSKGPSCTIYQSDTSSMACLETAYRYIKGGLCDSALIGGSNICLHSYVSLNLNRMGLLCSDGKTKCFDKYGDGYVRAEAVSVLFLQKAKDARRIYAEIYHIKMNFGESPDSSSSSLGIKKEKTIESLKKTFDEFYSEIDISPSDVSYIEASASGIHESDAVELRAIEKVFLERSAIKVGSVKSNMGHSHAAAGVCALTKICLAYQTGELPPNLHYSSPQDDIAAVREGKIQVLTQRTPFDRGLIAMNSFSSFGTDIHALFKGHFKKRNLQRYATNIPRLVVVSAREETGVDRIIEDLINSAVDPEKIGLLHNIHDHDIMGHLHRGYTIIDSINENETRTFSKSVQYYSGSVPPVWFVYSGMGSQWPGMGKVLMKIPVFSSAIERCHRVLEPKGIDLIRVLTEPDESTFDNILNCFVGIAAVQIGLTDILRELGIVPDNIIGHSLGEMGCAYADGCLTAEETILASYSRGMASLETKFIRGAMAAVGLGFADILPLCPPEIDVACHNSAQSCTISGPAEVMATFVSDLKGKGIFAREVACSNIAYHSRYIAEAGPQLLKRLREIITEPKLRSKKWISTSVPKHKKNDPEAQFSSAEYHTNNLLNPVHFEEASAAIPANALLIEVAPHGLLQAILKRSHDKCTHVPLTKRGDPNPLVYFLEAIGRLYQAGLNPHVIELYPKIEYPVSTETPLLSHLVEWYHKDNWNVSQYSAKRRVYAKFREIVLSDQDDDYKYLRGHIRNGACVLPEAALLVFVWETMAMSLGVNYRVMSVRFEDVQIYNEVNIQKNKPLNVTVSILKGSNRFEVKYNNTVIMGGNIYESYRKNTLYQDPAGTPHPEEDGLILTNKDIYEMMHLKGLHYMDDFQTIQSSNANKTKADIKWTGDWITFLDGIIQFNIFARDQLGIARPKIINEINIQVKEHNITLMSAKNTNTVDAHHCKITGVTRCGGVLFKDITLTAKEETYFGNIILQTKVFMSHFKDDNINLENALDITLQLIKENVDESEIRIMDMDPINSTSVKNAIDKVNSYYANMPFNYNEVGDVKLPTQMDLNNNTTTKQTQFVTDGLLANQKIAEISHVPDGTFIITLEKYSDLLPKIPPYFCVIAKICTYNLLLVLLRKIDQTNTKNPDIIHIEDIDSMCRIPCVRMELEKSQPTILVSETKNHRTLGYVKRMNVVHPNKKINLILVDDSLELHTNTENTIFTNQIRKNLAINVLKRGRWGSFCHAPVTPINEAYDYTLTESVPGNPDSLVWVQKASSKPSSDIIQVCYAGISYQDTQKAVGKIKDKCHNFGNEFSGINSRGEKVMGLIREGALASSIESDPYLLWPVPDHWSLEDAATVPLAYVHAYYCLAIRHNVYKGDSVLVEGGTGRLAQALITVCLAMGCDVFVTVSNTRKKQELLGLFQNLKESNVTCVRGDALLDAVLASTDGEGCNVVIVSSSGPSKEDALKCVSKFGIVLDTTEEDMDNNKLLGMNVFDLDHNYISVNLFNLFNEENLDEKKAIQMFISEGIAKGFVKPLSRVVYYSDFVSRAFRTVSSTQNIARVLLKIGKPGILRLKNVVPRSLLTSAASYVVINTGRRFTFGLKLVDILVSRGATNIIIISEQCILSGHLQTKLVDWKKSNVSVKTLVSPSLDVLSECDQILHKASELEQINGIFFVADTLDDSVVEPGNRQEMFEEDVNKTAEVLYNVDLISRENCLQLRYFVVITGLYQNAVDVYIESVSDSICQSRKEMGFPGLAIHVNVVDQTCSSKKLLAPFWTNSILKQVESCLDVDHANITILMTNKTNISNEQFMAKIAEILGIGNINDLEDSMTIDQFTLNDVNIEEIRVLIRGAYKLNYTAKDVKLLSIGRLKLLCDISRQDNVFDFNSGLGAFYQFVDDETLASKPLIPMRTRISDANEEELNEDPNEPYLVLIPGFEGHFRVFKEICARLKVRAMAFNLSPEIAEISIPQMAVMLKKFLTKRIKLRSRFYILGYSFGVNLALELASLIEKEGYVGVVYCLDASPDTLPHQLDAYLGTISEAELQNAIIEHMYHVMTGDRSDNLKNILTNIEHWGDKVAACLNELRGVIKFSREYTYTLINAAYQRIIQSQQYKPEIKLQSTIVLIKGIPHPNCNDLSDDYNLSQYTSQPLEIYQSEMDHSSILKDCNVTNIVNRFLDSQILEDFKTRNSCQTYVMNMEKTSNQN